MRVALHHRFELVRLAEARRAAVERLLAETLRRDGYHVGEQVTSSQLTSLLRSFRLVARAAEEEEPIDLLAHANAPGRRPYLLLNAPTGYGKTTYALAVALAATRRHTLARTVHQRRPAIPVYVEFTKAELALDQLDDALRLLAARASRVPEDWRARPVFLLDGANETIGASDLARRLGQRKDLIAASGATLVFLFSYRHRSFSAALRSEFAREELPREPELTLPFDVRRASDLAFFRLLAPGADFGAIERFLIAYSAEHDALPLSRLATSALVKWLIEQDAPAGPELVARAPSPASIVFRQTVAPDERATPELATLASIAFDLLGRERTLADEAALRDRHVTAADLDRIERVPLVRTGRVRTDGLSVRFERESDVRALGALHIVLRLAPDEGMESPHQLRGRTTYDVAAPLVPAAWSWRFAGAREEAARVHDLELLLEGELQQEDGPYSFYARVLSTNRDIAIDQDLAITRRLVRGLIRAIDDDRERTCVQAITEAHGSEAVLDQLFEVMDAYGRRLVLPLLELMGEDENPLVKSQAAYLLLAWVTSLRHSPPDPRDRPVLEQLARGIAKHGNLHLRFHQVELVEALLGLEVAGAGDAAERVRQSEHLTGLGDTDGTTEPSLHQALSEYLAGLMDRERDRGALRLKVAATLDTLPVGARANPSQLECLETALGLASKEFCREPDEELAAHVCRALTNELWIVRWWGIANLVTMLKDAATTASAGDLAEIIVGQLTVSEEPAGLKHRQCALVRDLLELPVEHPARQLIRAQLIQQVAGMLEPDGRARFEAGYRSRLGRDPGSYLVEFYGRLEALLSDARG